MRSTWFIIATLPAPLLADIHGSVSGQDISDNATICLQIGAQASLTGLDDFTLTTNDVSGAAGSTYHGSDDFHLESNVPVRITIDGGPLKRGSDEISATFKVDGKSQFFDTLSDSNHAGTHTLDVEARLKAISSQQAGNYATTVVLTVAPQVGSDSGCGAFTLQMPGTATGSDYAVIAFEDLYPSPGDADYNDFVVRYSVSESYNADNELEQIDLSFTPIARGAGYNHKLMLDLDGVIENTHNAFATTDEPFAGDATVVVSYNNLDNDTTRTKYYDKDDDIVLFGSTRSSLTGFANVYDDGTYTAPRSEVNVTITLDDPSLNLAPDDNDIAIDKYRVFLDVLNTNKDIDLAVVNPDDGMIDENGYPFGVLVPDDWAWMLESEHIDEAYPHFEEYRRYLAGETSELSPEAEFWFETLDTSSDAVVDLDALQDYLDGQ